MATFNRLPSELLHKIAQNLAPTCFEDFKQDILAFRLIERRTWLVANRYAFKYMTLCVGAEAKRTRLGYFGGGAQKDSSGFDIRCAVEEIRFRVNPIIQVKDLPRTGKFLDGFTWEDSRGWSRNQAQRAFAQKIGKKEGEQLDADEQATCEHYWKLFVEPYLLENDILDEKMAYTVEKLESRLREDLAYFPNIHTVSIDVASDVLDTKSESYRVLDRKGLLNKFWISSSRRMISISETRSPQCQYMSYFKDVIYYNRPLWGQEWLLLTVLSPRITKVVWASENLRLEHALRPEGLRLINIPCLVGITDVEVTCGPLWRRLWQRRSDRWERELSKLKPRILKLISSPIQEVVDAPDYEILIEPERYNLLYEIVEDIMPPCWRVEKLHISGFFVSPDSWHVLLPFAAARDLNAVFEDIILVKEFPNDARDGDLFERTLKEISLDWLHLIAESRQHLYDYVEVDTGKLHDYLNSGKLSFQGTFRAQHQRSDPLLSVQQTLSTPTLNMLHEYMRTGYGEEVLMTELYNENWETLANEDGSSHGDAPQG